MRLTLVCLVFFAGIYSLIILGIAKAVPGNGEGDVLLFKGERIGYALEGQSFTADNYFWSRPSAVAYNAAGSGGSNKGPTNPDYLTEVGHRIDSLLRHNPGLRKEDIPSEMVTASGSGLDPDISPAGADIQIDRIARIRHLPKELLLSLVQSQVERPLFGFLGPEKINVLRLNMALDTLSAK